MKTFVDARLRDEQAGFRIDRSCMDHIVTLSIIIEQSIEWNSSLYMCFFFYFKKAFDSVDKQTLWKLLQHYWIPEDILTLIRSAYDPFTCQVTDNNVLTAS